MPKSPDLMQWAQREQGNFLNYQNYYAHSQRQRIIYLCDQDLSKLFGFLVPTNPSKGYYKAIPLQ